MLVSRACDITVRWDERTLEQCHRDMMSALRSTFGCRASDDRNSLAQPFHAPDWNDEVPFDLQGYGPDDIKVSTSDNGVTVHSKNFVQTDRALSSREYSRTICIPKSVDKNQLKCHLTEDGVLMLGAAVRMTDYKSITFDRDR
ncbi:Hsp20/alpha crystallin family protein [Opisthorchis viverrini]|uniref:Hsp20/alpha crystallin family protein n=1 Tax=Opisthorchis viverrini TaxID=6198 RepID=A0A1S8WQ48_OPIVI|nr:Hsp20/alpha crystallin family protein [Opisthorchis viverrini]